MSSLNLKNIYKVYPSGVTAVTDFNLDIEDKEFIVFVGPSGCGKSTTLRMIAGLEEISAGELYIDGQLVNNRAPKDRDIAMVFQNYALYPHMTVYDNMAFGLKLRKCPNPKSTKELEKQLEFLVLKCTFPESRRLFLVVKDNVLRSAVQSFVNRRYSFSTNLCQTSTQNFVLK